ncbi:hypothetical protein FA13DRAFT_1739648 [Coprinellus micaceus]|uniref:Uncharacterized protein n=1 Tax=Coprinellus micaceus TaxID=71717 RepID=A0A4Y7SQC8_COPMI|nr:hypothetical protein FA13DRAFT_1739648 [Coprinellus micaceus]
MAFCTLGHYSVFAAPVTNNFFARDMAGGDAAFLDARADSTDISSLDSRELEFGPALLTRCAELQSGKRRQGGRRPGAGVQGPKKSFAGKVGKILSNPNAYAVAGHALGGAVGAYANLRQSQGRESRLAPIAGVYNGVVNPNNGYTGGMAGNY